MNRIMFFICSICMASLCSARDFEETFLQANRYYQNKEYQKALDLYDSIDRKGVATWHNMGNCAFKLNRHLDALTCWKRARKTATAKEQQELDRNIETAYEVLGKEVDNISFWLFFRRLLDRCSLFFLQLLFLSFWFILFGVLWFFKRYKRVFLATLIPINILCGLTLIAKYRLQKYPVALVKKTSASLFAGPDQNYHVISKVKLADEFSITERCGSWCKVRGSSLSGWILADTLVEI